MILLNTRYLSGKLNDDTKRLPGNYLKLLEEEREKYLSVVTCWEISLLLEKDRLNLKYPFKEWILNSIKAHRIEIINLDLEIIFAYDNLYNFPVTPRTN